MIEKSRYFHICVERTVKNLDSIEYVNLKKCDHSIC